MTAPNGRSYSVACSICGEPVIGVVTRRGRRRRFCSAACRAKAVLQWKSRNRLKNRDETAGPLLPLPGL
jgi:endogenous inhibitor of DNA gyrase (YacG/DUF329 family)